MTYLLFNFFVFSVLFFLDADSGFELCRSKCSFVALAMSLFLSVTLILLPLPHDYFPQPVPDLCCTDCLCLVHCGDFLHPVPDVCLFQGICVLFRHQLTLKMSSVERD